MINELNNLLEMIYSTTSSGHSMWS